MRPQKLVITLTESEHWARERYGIDAVAKELPGDIDRNILLTGEDDTRWVLKLAPTGSVQLEIECQLAALQFLEASDLRDLVPRLVPDRNGAATSTVSTAAGDEGWLRLVTYLPGYPLAELDRASASLRREVGSKLGRLDRLLTAFDHPGAHRHLMWDIVNVLELSPLQGAVAPDLRALVVSGMEAFESRVLPRLVDLPKSIIHNDANDYNLMIEVDSGRPRLSGLIDFGDIVHTVTVAEPAIACAYAMLGTQDPKAAADEIIAGYESERALSDLEHAVLPDLIIARLCCSLLMSAQARAMAPDDKYLRISERPMADLLKRLSS